MFKKKKLVSGVLAVVLLIFSVMPTFTNVHETKSEYWTGGWVETIIE